jgi:hypothetical protein
MEKLIEIAKEFIKYKNIFNINYGDVDIRGEYNAYFYGDCVILRIHENLYNIFITNVFTYESRENKDIHELKETVEIDLKFMNDEKKLTEHYQDLVSLLEMVKKLPIERVVDSQIRILESDIQRNENEIKKLKNKIDKLNELLINK